MISTIFLPGHSLLRGATKFYHFLLEQYRTSSVSCLFVQDYDQNGNLSYEEFSGLIDAFGNQLAATKVCM